MNRTDLYRSFNDMDDDILERSEKSKKMSMYVWKRWGTIAACFCLLVIGGINLFYQWRNIGKQEGLGNHEKPMVIYLVDSVVEKSAGTLTYHTDNFDEHTMKFTLEKKNDLEMYVLFTGCNILKEWTDVDGTHYEIEEYVAMSPYSGYEQQPNRKVIMDALVIKVNGVEVDKLPTEPGIYEISIYYGELYNRLDDVNKDVEILGFGHFMIDCEEFKQNHP